MRKLRRLSGDEVIQILARFGVLLGVNYSGGE